VSPLTFLGLLLSSNQDSLRPDDALYLFETTGLLLGKTGLTPSLQQSSLAGVMTPHVRSMEAMLQSELRTQDPGYLGERLARSIAAIAYVSKGFSKPPPEVQSVFMQTIAITLGVLEAFPANDEVRSKSMIFLQRMILCIGSDILPSLPRFLQVLVEQCTVQDAQDVSQLLNQISIKFKEQAVPALDAALLPFLRKCHMLAPTVDDVSVGSNSDIPPHLRTEQLTIQKLSYTVLQHIVSYRATPVLISSTNAGSFERVLHTMKEGATLVQDASVKKACLTFFRELCDQWLADDVVNGAASIRNGYLRYMLETFVPEMLKCFLQPTFDEVDAMQARNVSEFAQILFAVKTKSTRDEYELFLRTLSSNGCPSNIVEAFRTASIASEMELCLKEMLKVLKGRQQG
jgi:exportin-T